MVEHPHHPSSSIKANQPEIPWLAGWDGNTRGGCSSRVIFVWSWEESMEIGILPIADYFFIVVIIIHHHPFGANLSL